jgi:hypothetical protein
MGNTRRHHDVHRPPLWWKADRQRRSRLASRGRQAPPAASVDGGLAATSGLAIVDRLLHAEAGTRIDLGAMPPEGVARCRAAWARLVGRRTCAVRGDANPRNIRMTADRVALIDWDESNVDVPDLELVLPHNVAGLDGGAHGIAAQASAAWEAAVCWDDAHAIKRLAQVRAV